MSKTAQRKRSLYEQGYNDGIGEGWYRWKRHPLISFYHAGFRRGERDKELKKVPGWVVRAIELASR